MNQRPTVGPNSMYIGLLGCYDDLKVYGKQHVRYNKTLLISFFYYVHFFVKHLCTCVQTLSGMALKLFFFIFSCTFPGYNTSTKTKFLATVEDSVHDENQQFVREAGLKALFVSESNFLFWFLWMFLHGPTPNFILLFISHSLI